MKLKNLSGTVSSLLISVSPSVYCNDTIVGAFGIEFGTLLENVKVIESHVNSQIHNVEPPQPMSLLRFYTVDTTGPDKKIYRITGQTLENNRQACLEDLSTITSILKNKYGPMDQTEGFFRIQKNNRSIIASCDQEGGDDSRKTYKLKVTYEDKGLVGGADAL